MTLQNHRGGVNTRPGATLQQPITSAFKTMPHVIAAPPGVNELALYDLKPRAIWRFLKAQPMSFWFVCCYLFFEYVRPQSIWPALDVLPWGQTSLLLTLIAALAEGRLFSRRWTSGDVTLTLFTLVLILSSLMAVSSPAAVSGWSLYFSWVLVFVLITATVTTEARFFIFMLLFLLCSFKMSQHGFRSWASIGFGFRGWGVAGGPGWFHNSGEFGIQMCVFLPLSVEFILALRNAWSRRLRWAFYLLPITAVASIIASSSRGALVGAAAVSLWWVARSKHRVRALLAIASVAAVTWFALPDESKARFASSGEDHTSTTRIERWEAGMQMAAERPILGVGYNNWEVVYGPLSHNIFIQALAELGYTGLLAFLAMIAATFVLNHRSRHMAAGTETTRKFITHMAYGLDGALIGYLVSGFFVTVLYYPFFWINLAMTVSLHIAARQSRGRTARPAARQISPRLVRARRTV